MLFFQTILFGASLVAAVTIDKYPTAGVTAGQTYTITYSPADDTPTTFVLRKGKSTNLDTVGTLTTTATGGTFQWTPSTSLENEDDYALEVIQGNDNNYSGQFPLTGGSDSAPSSTAMSSAMSTASSAAASASSVSAAISSAMSSAMATITSAASASAMPSASAGLNSTVTSATLSRSAHPSSTSTKVPEVSTAAGSSLGSPMAAILGAAAAFAYFA